MIKQNSILFRSFFVALLAFFWFVSVGSAQDKNDAETTGDGEGELVAVPMVTVATPTDDDDSKVTGATVRGRLVYEDTNRPMRYVLVTLVQPKDANYGMYGTKFVKTDETGNFVIRNVKAGSYVAYVKSEGILNQDSYKFSYRRANQENKPEEIFEKIEISGLGEFQIVVAARRGGAISGKIVYADGEVAVGVKVEALRKEGEIFSNISSSYSSGNKVGVAETDDRGYYRIPGLPEGQYIVRVIEPFSHGRNSAAYLYNLRDEQNSILRTYYPEGENSKTAKEMEVLPGQEQAGIDIILPERRLFTLSGRIAKKKDGTPLGNFSVNFYPISERDPRVADSFTGNATASNKNGEWTLKGLPKGKYRITISQGYEYTERAENQKKEAFTNMAREIEITDENLADVNFDVPSEASVVGTVVAEGGKDVPDGIRMMLYNEETMELNYSDYNYEGNKKAPTKKQMAFRIGKMNEGKYRLPAITSNTYYVKSATLGGRDVMNSSFEIKEGESLSGLQIVISTNMGTVKGKVSGYDGKTEVVVAVIESGAIFGSMQSKSFSTRIQPSGDFEVKAAPGEYTIVVLTPKNRPQTREEAKTWFENLIKNGQKISVKDNETTNVSVGLPD